MTTQKSSTRRFYVWERAYVDDRRDSVIVLASSAREAARIAGYDKAVSDLCFSDQNLLVFNRDWRPRGTFVWKMSDSGGLVCRIRSNRALSTKS